MKKLFLTLGVAALSFGAYAQGNQADLVIDDAADATQAAPISGAQISFASEVVDYGEIEYAADGQRHFEFTNTGNEPLIITKCKGSCGCTVPKCPLQPILPGESAKIDVKYDTKRMGPFTKTITVSSNVEGPAKLLKIKGKVLPKPDEVTAPIKKNVSPVQTPN